MKFLTLDFLGVLHRILWKREKAIYHIQIPALVPEISKYEKCVKYANEMTADVIHSTQYYIMYIRLIELSEPIYSTEKRNLIG